MELFVSCVLLLLHTPASSSGQQCESTNLPEYVMSPGLEVIKLFSSSAQLSMKFQLLINVEIVKNSGKFRFKSHKLVIYPADKC